MKILCRARTWAKLPQMCLGYFWALWGKTNFFWVHLLAAPAAADLPAQGSAPSCLIPAVFLSPHLISVKKQLNHRWAPSLHNNTCSLSHSIHTLSGICCTSDPLTPTQSSGHGPNSLLIASSFSGASTGLLLLLEAMPRLRLNAAWACCRWIGYSYAFKASSFCFVPVPSIAWHTVNLLGARRLPGFRAGTWAWHAALDGCTVVSGGWRLADLTLLLCHSSGLCTTQAPAPSKTHKNAKRRRLTLRLPEVAGWRRATFVY